MARPVTMFTGQWADLPLEELAAKCSGFGYDGLELACWGDHFEIDKALAEDDYCAKKHELLEKYDMQVFAISSHLVGQAVLDNIDGRHEAILPPHIWGDGEPAGVNARAAEDMIGAARAAQKLGVSVVNGFTGSSIWHLLYSFPPVPAEMIEEGFKLLAERWNPILDVFGECGVKFALEVHPTEIAFDIVTAERALEALGYREEFGFNFDPSHLQWQGVDPVEFIREFPDRMYHVHIKDVSESLAAAVRGKDTGIAVSQCALGDGVNADNIRLCLKVLRDHGYDGVLSMECEGQGGPMIERSLAWMRKTLAELQIPIEE